MSRKNAFTLVELLVVISIIGLLIAILLPSLQGARRSAQAIICASNLRQLSTGWTIYAQQSNGAIVPGRTSKFSESENIYWVGNGYQYRPRWFIQVGAEAGFYAYDKPSADPADDNTKTVDNRLFICPTRPDWINNRNYTYGYNYQFLGNSRFKVDAAGDGDANLGLPTTTANIARPVPCAEPVGVRNRTRPPIPKTTSAIAGCRSTSTAIAADTIANSKYDSCSSTRATEYPYPNLRSP